MNRGIFITGTDTNVGKTIVTAGALRYLRRKGVDAVSMKPVQTGAEPRDGGFIAPDLIVHHLAAGYEPSEEERTLMAPHLYEPECSPHLAGRMAGRFPDIPHILECATELFAQHDFLLVEGAGGVMAPLDETSTMLDLMKAMAFPVILVAHRGLGTINHSLLSLKALRDAGLLVLGVIFNERHDRPTDYIGRDNPETVARFGHVEILGDIDFLKDLSEASWDHFDACTPGLRALLDTMSR